jgi:glyoxylase-like metal-dependent hydrolase (beta-lactamase superfamily II)
MSGLAARNACGEREEGTADQAARSVHCRADGFGVADVIVLLLALCLYFLREYPLPKPPLRVTWKPLSAGWAHGGTAARPPCTGPGPRSPARARRGLGWRGCRAGLTSVHSGTLGWLSASGSNVYFVRSGLSWVLIDTSWPDRGQVIKQAAERLFGAGTRPAAILLTHAHGDHAGSPLEPARSWDLPVYVHPGELPLAAGKYLPEYGDPIGRWLIEPLMRLMPRRAARMAAKASITEAAQAFTPEAGVPGLPDWQCIPTPGHTPGHVCFFRPTDRVLITGDAVLTLNFNSLRDLLRWKQRVSGPPWISCATTSNSAFLRPQTGRPRRRRCSWGSDSATQRAPCSSLCATRPESRPDCTSRRSAGASSEISIRACGTCCYPGACPTPGWKQTLTGDGGGSMPTSTTTPSARRLHASSSGTAGQRDTPGRHLSRRGSHRP